MSADRSCLFFLATISLALIFPTRALAGAQKFNPGLVAKFPKKSLYPVMVLTLPTLNPLISHIEIDQRFELSIITLKGFDIDFEPLAKEQIVFDFADPNSFSTSVASLKFSFKSPVDIKIWVFQSKGWIRAMGKVRLIKFRTAGIPFTDKYANKPYVQLSFEDIQLTADDIDIHADIDWVPDFVMHQIMSFIKTDVVEAVRKTMLDWLNSQFTPNINDKIKEQYPDDMQIGAMDSSMRVALTDPVEMTKDDIIFKLDGTVFVTAKGFLRKEDSPRIDLAPTTSHTFQLYLTDYVGRTFFEVIWKQFEEFHVTDFQAGITSLDERVGFTVSERGMKFDRFHSTAKLTCYDKLTEIDSVMSGVLKPSIRKEEEGFVLGLEAVEFRFDEGTMKSNYPVLESLTETLKWSLETYLKAEPMMSIPMPDIDLFGQRWKDWAVDAGNGYLKIGVTI